MKLLCMGDLHLGHGAALGRAPGDRLKDQDDVLQRIADLAVARDVDALLVAGDSFEGPTVPPEQLDAFARFIARCRDADIPVLAALGNGRHDQAVRATNGMNIFRHIPGIRVASTPQIDFIQKAGGIYVCSLPWVHPGRVIAATDGAEDRDDVNRRMADLLVQTARGLRENITGDATTVLMLHWAVSGASLPNGLPVDDLAEPVLDAHALVELGFDAIVCGHIHKPQGMSEEIPFFYVGSPMPLNFGETQTAHGVTILELEPGFGALKEIDFVEIESRPLRQFDLSLMSEGAVEIVNEGDLEDVAGITDVDRAIVKVVVRATSSQQRRLDIPALRDELSAAGAHSVKIVVEPIREDRARVDTVTEDLAPLDAYDAWTGANDVDLGVAARARVQLAEDLETVTT